MQLESEGNEPGPAVGNFEDGGLVVLKRGVQHFRSMRRVRIRHVLERPGGRILFTEDAGAPTS